MKTDEVQAIYGFIQTGIFLEVGCGDTKINMPNVKGVDPNVPTDMMIEFEKIMALTELVDGIIFPHILRHFKNPTFSIKKAGELIKPGGELFIIEDVRRDPSAKHYWNVGELESFLRLFGDWFEVIHRNMINDKVFMITLKRKGVE